MPHRNEALESHELPPSCLLSMTPYWLRSRSDPQQRDPSTVLRILLAGIGFLLLHPFKRRQGGTDPNTGKPGGGEKAYVGAVWVVAAIVTGIDHVPLDHTLLPEHALPSPRPGEHRPGVPGRLAAAAASSKVPGFPSGTCPCATRGNAVAQPIPVPWQLGRAGCGAAIQSGAGGSFRDCLGGGAYAGVKLHRSPIRRQLECWLVFACAKHVDQIDAARPLLDRDRARTA